jgi:hypothetical protein
VELQALLASPHPPMLALQVRRRLRLLRLHALLESPAHPTLHPITRPAASMHDTLSLPPLYIQNSLPLPATSTCLPPALAPRRL